MCALGGVEVELFLLPPPLGRKKFAAVIGVEKEDLPPIPSSQWGPTFIDDLSGEEINVFEPPHWTAKIVSPHSVGVVANFFSHIPNVGTFFLRSDFYCLAQTYLAMLHCRGMQKTIDNFSHGMALALRCWAS